jgi:hypothetical protein
MAAPARQYNIGMPIVEAAREVNRPLAHVRGSVD